VKLERLKPDVPVFTTFNDETVENDVEYINDSVL
jgi:hypothetical protein